MRATGRAGVSAGIYDTIQKQFSKCTDAFFLLRRSLDDT